MQDGERSRHRQAVNQQGPLPFPRQAVDKRHKDNESDFEEGYLRKISNIRPNRIFTADCKIILYKAGHIKSDKIDEVLKKIIDILAN